MASRSLTGVFLRVTGTGQIDHARSPSSPQCPIELHIPADTAG